MQDIPDHIRVRIFTHLNIIELVRINNAAKNFNIGNIFEPDIQQVVDIKYKTKKINFETIDEAANSDIVKKLINLKEDDKTSTYICNNAVKGGHLDCLRYAHENGCPWDYNTCWRAAENGHLDCLKYARENGCPWDKRTCWFAAEYGHLECLKYAHENGCRWDEYTCSEAAKNGHLDCLKYLHENGCPWDKDTCEVAARNGHLDILKYSHENGCPWGEWTCRTAIVYGYLDCLTYFMKMVVRGIDRRVRMLRCLVI